MDQSLIMNDGTKILDAYALTSSGILWVYIQNGMTLDEAYNLLKDPEKTAVITSSSFGIVSTFEHFTGLFCIRVEENGLVTAGLRREGAD